jgi:hypothetical protein
MIIEVPQNQLAKLVAGIKQYKLRHGPFNRTSTGYKIYLYPSNKLTLLFLMSDLEILK